MRLLLKTILLVLVCLTGVGAEDFPLTITYRKAITGAGYVVTMKNTADSSFRVKFAALDKTTEKVVDAGALWELGHAEGFTFAVGDKFTVTVGDKSVQQVIPEIKTPPLALSFRKAVLGSSLVLVVQRNKDTVKAIHVVCERPSTGEKKIFDNSAWGPSNLYEIGHLEGWSFKKGDRATVTGEGFEPMVQVAE